MAVEHWRDYLRRRMVYELPKPKPEPKLTRRQVLLKALEEQKPNHDGDEVPDADDASLHRNIYG